MRVRWIAVAAVPAQFVVRRSFERTVRKVGDELLDPVLSGSPDIDARMARDDLRDGDRIIGVPHRNARWTDRAVDAQREILVLHAVTRELALEILLLSELPHHPAIAGATHCHRIRFAVFRTRNRSAASVTA